MGEPRKVKVKSYKAQVKCAGGCGSVLKMTNITPLKIVGTWKCVNCEARSARIRHRLISTHY